MCVVWSVSGLTDGVKSGDFVDIVFPIVFLFLSLVGV